MARVREGGQGALVVVDVQVGVVDGAWEVDRVVGNVARAHVRHVTCSRLRSALPWWRW